MNQSCVDWAEYVICTSGRERRSAGRAAVCSELGLERTCLRGRRRVQVWFLKTNSSVMFNPLKQSELHFVQVHGTLLTWLSKEILGQVFPTALRARRGDRYQFSGSSSGMHVKEQMLRVAGCS